MSRRLFLLAVVSVPLFLSANPLWGQETPTPETASPVTTAPVLDPCILEWSPIQTGTRSSSARDTTGYHVTHLYGRTLWTCGPAFMEADRAIKYDGEQRVELFGNVTYEDTLRSIRSDQMQYFEITDLLIAESQVRLNRISDGAELTGPRVEFVRAISGINAETIATGRPHILFYPDSAQNASEPVEIDADSVLFVGEDRAAFTNNVHIRRSDFDARGDDATFERTGSGTLTGNARFETEGILVVAEMLSFTGTSEAVESVQASGGAYAVGEQIELRAEVIDVTVEDQVAKEIFAHGDGVSQALSGAQLIYGDDMRFLLSDGALETVIASGDAIGVQIDSTLAKTGLERIAEHWIEEQVLADSIARADSIALADSLAAEEDEDAAEADEGLVVDGEEDTQEESVEEGSTEGVVEGEGPGDDVGEGDEEDTEGEEADQEEDLLTGPRLALDGSTSWVRGDSLIATFTPSAYEEVAPDSVTEDDADLATDEEAPPVIERLVLIGEARAFYVVVTDSTAPDRKSRSYTIGTTIEIEFEEGEPSLITGDNTIGVWLNPEDTTAPQIVSDSLSTDSLPNNALPRSLPDFRFIDTLGTMLQVQGADEGDEPSPGFVGMAGKGGSARIAGRFTSTAGTRTRRRM